MDEHLVAQLRALVSASDVEVCGALVGAAERVSAVWPLPNRSAQPHNSFLIPAEDVLLAEKWAQQLRLDVVGFYHSHPRGAAAPSQADLAQALPGYIYTIVTREGEVRSWRLRADRAGFDEVL